MRIVIAALSLALIISSGGAAAPTPWEAYIAYPSHENAARVRTASYTNPNDRDDRLYEDLWMLQVQVISRDSAAVALAFRLFDGSDGHFTETLDIMLGRLIRIDPTLFLTVLKENRSTTDRLDGLVANVGEVYVDNSSAECYELERRIASLLTVADSSLIPTRDECIDVLNEVIAKYCSDTASEEGQ